MPRRYRRATLALVSILWTTVVLPAQAPGGPVEHQEAVAWLAENRDNPQLPGVLLAAIETAPRLSTVTELLTSYLPLVDRRADRGQILYRSGQIRELANDFEGARLAYARALEADPELWDAAIRRAALAVEAGSVSEAILILTRIINQAPSRAIQRRAAVVRARAHLIGGDLEIAYDHAAALTGYPEGERSLVSPAAYLLFYEVSRARGLEDAAAWSRERLSETPSGTLEGRLVDEETDDGIRFFPSPSRILGGLPTGPEVAIATEQRATTAQEDPSGVAGDGSDLSEDGASGDDREPRVRGVQTGSFRDPENAQYMAEDVRALGFQAEVVTTIRNDQTFYRVLVPLRDQSSVADAQQTVVALKEYGVEGFLVFESGE